MFSIFLKNDALDVKDVSIKQRNSTYHKILARRNKIVLS